MSDRIMFQSCPLCDSDKHVHLLSADCSRHPLFDKRLNHIINWRNCNECNHIFTDGFYTDKAFNIILSKTQENQFVGYQLESNRFVSARIIEKILPYSSGGIWLDVGFGNGSLLITADEFGFKTIGLDMREKNVTSIKKLGIDAYVADLSKININQLCSVISMCDVLEHVAFPKEYLRAANTLMKDDGCLFLSMPNTDSIIWKLMTQSQKNAYWIEIEHFHNFGRVNLYKLLDEHGFRPIKYSISERYKASMEIIAVKYKSI